MYKFKNELTFKSPKKYENILKIYVSWDSNDGDYIGTNITMKPEQLFDDKKLIYCLAYLSCNYNFKNHDWNAPVFCHHIDENEDIDEIFDIICDADLMCYSDWGACHSLEEISIMYYDENGNAFDVTFADIHERWKTMSYDEICDEINNING